MNMTEDISCIDDELGDDSICESDLKREYIESAVLRIGISSNMKGYYYIVDAVDMRIEDDIISGISVCRLYDRIAEKHNTGVCNVERNIRYSLKVMSDRKKIKNLNEFVGYDMFNKFDRPTNSEFIMILANSMKKYKRKSIISK